MQVLVDMSTPAGTFDIMDAAVAAHLEANPNDFTGKHLVVANNASDPLKFMLCIWWEYCHPGANKTITDIDSTSLSSALMLSLLNVKSLDQQDSAFQKAEDMT